MDTYPFKISDRPYRRRTTSHWYLLLVVAAMITAVAGCGSNRERSLCAVYEDYGTSLAGVRAIDPTSKSAGEAAVVLTDFLADVRRLRETDSRNATALNDLESAVATAVVTIESLDNDADYSTWAPLIKDSVTKARDAAARVETLMEPQCPQQSDR